LIVEGEGGVTVRAIRPGSPLPKLVLADQDKAQIDVSTIRRARLLSFHPLAWTGVCQRQMEALEMNADVFAGLNAQAFGISVDPVPSKKAWADAIGVKRTRLLSDFWPHGAASSSLGLFREADGFSERASVIVDAGGMVRFVKVYPIGEVPDIAELLEALKRL
jgi:peroxiredoxin